MLTCDSVNMYASAWICIKVTNVAMSPSAGLSRVGTGTLEELEI